MSTNLYMDINFYPDEKKALDENSFLIVDHVLEKETYIPLHFHDYFELEIILSGKVEYECNKKRYTAERGFACLMSANDLHCLRFLEDTRILNIRFTDKILPETLKFLFHAFVCMFTDNELVSLLQSVEEIKGEQQGRLSYSKLIISHRISEIMINMIRKTVVDSEIALTDYVHKTILYINKHFKEDINLISCAKELSLSPDHLGRMIKKATGTPFTEYLNTTRMKYATTLLSSTNLSIKEIAAKSGYNSTAYFLYKFKKTFSTTPQKYRNMRSRVRGILNGEHAVKPRLDG